MYFTRRLFGKLIIFSEYFKDTEELLSEYH